MAFFNETLDLNEEYLIINNDIRIKHDCYENQYKKALKILLEAEDNFNNKLTSIYVINLDDIVIKLETNMDEYNSVKVHVYSTLVPKDKKLYSKYLYV